MTAGGTVGAVMVCGTSSDAGKSHVASGICRLLARRGVRVAPFKGQNMSLNSAVTAGGHEIGRAQEAQARAARVEPEVAMNPVLLKPTGERTSQVVVMGRPWRTLDAATFHAAKAELAPVVLGALEELRRRFDVVVCEGAGSPAEINLLDDDLVNLGLAAQAGIPALIVGDIERGGVFAHLYGTVALLPDALRDRVRGFVVNKFRGDPELLGDATKVLEARCGVPTLGVVPYLPGVGLDAEDSLSLPSPSAAWGATGAGGATLDVAVVRFPRISNFTDLDALALEPALSVRFVDSPGALGEPDVVVLPGTRSTVADLDWAEEQGIVAAIERRRADPSRRPVVLGICGGYQMLGSVIEDPGGVESAVPVRRGLGWLGVTTRFEEEKRTRRRRGLERRSGLEVEGYEIHHGRPVVAASAEPWFSLEAGEPEGCLDRAGGLYGTRLHGVLESDPLRDRFLGEVARARGKRWVSSGVSFAAAREGQIDRLADACEAALDVPRLLEIIEIGRHR
ncbi:MAG TPA: cobyric acid synthase [Acidimicrobiales bacterium]|jgi:adenosylcobyric acid synthase